MIVTKLMTNVSEKNKIKLTSSMELILPKGQRIDSILTDSREHLFNITIGRSQPNDLPHVNVCLSPVANEKFRTNGELSIKMSVYGSGQSNFTTDMNKVQIHLNKNLILPLRFGKSKSYLPIPKDKLILDCEIILNERLVTNLEYVDSIKVPGCNLTEDLGALLETKEFADVTIVTADDHKIPAHKTILSARSKVFAAMFRHSMKENTENCVDIGDFSADVIMELLRFIYTGEAPNLKEIAMDMMTAADKYELDRLKAMCASSLSDNLSIETAPTVLKLADLYNIEDLKSNAIRFIKTNIDIIKETDKWKELIKTNRKLIIASFIKENSKNLI